MIVAKYGNYVRKFIWQLCERSRVNICMTFHKRAFVFLIPLHIDLTTFKIARLLTVKEKPTLPYPHSCHINCRTYTVAILGHNHFESPNIIYTLFSKIFLFQKRKENPFVFYLRHNLTLIGKNIQCVQKTLETPK
jgi:hypothetical protein